MRTSMLALVVVVSHLVGCGSEPGEEVSSSSTGELTVARWMPLGSDLGPGPSFSLSAPSLAADPLARPVLAFSSYDPTTFTDSTTVSGWNGSAWVPLGSAFAGADPSIGIDSRKRTLACFGSGPFVKRWNGSRWNDLGGDISTETGYRGLRHGVSGCEGLVLDSRREPIVAWSADVGAKANFIYAARWSSPEHRWIGIGGPIGSRATDAALDIDDDDRVYLATFTPGGSYGGQNTTRAFRWNGSAWTQLGEDMPDTSAPTVSVYESRAYLAYGVLRDGAQTMLEVARWVGHSWRSVGPRLPGTSPRIDFSPSGEVVMAYVHAEGIPGDAGRLTVRVVHLAGRSWQPIGRDLADVTSKLVQLDMALDSMGRPTVAWSEQDGSGASALFVRRFSAAVQ